MGRTGRLVMLALGLAWAAPLRAQQPSSEPPAHTFVYTINGVDVQPSRLPGAPAVVYPRSAWRRQSAGRAIVQGIVDTSGRFEPASLEIVEVPDSDLIEPVRVAMLASRFSPGRVKGEPVRTLMRLGIELKPGPGPNPTALVTEARAQLARGRADSALDQVEFALDPLVGAPPGARVYAGLVRAVALRALGRDSLADVALRTALAQYGDLTRRGVDLSPTLRHLADSLRRAQRGPRAATAAGTPTALDAVDQQPALVSTPPIAYPPEMQALRVGGTVIVEVTVDTVGHVVPGTARVATTPNPGLNAAALSLVSGAVYRPARRGGRAVRVVLRQPVTFSP
jgi:TonB family protein